MNTEEMIIEFESARNDAIDKYFIARPQLVRTKESERLVESGFRMAWNKLKREQSSQEDIEQAHMAGQHSAGVDPGYSLAQEYFYSLGY